MYKKIVLKCVSLNIPIPKNTISFLMVILKRVLNVPYLIHQHHDDRQLSQNFEGQRPPGDDGVLEAETRRETQ